MRFPDARVLIFAKAPEAGLVKTRLIPALGPQGAADLHARLLTDTLARIVPAGLAPVELWCAPEPGRDPFPSLAARHGLALHRQRGPGLGERMRYAAADALRRSARVVLIGTDCPRLDAEYIGRALRALTGRDAVLGPAEDGGYVLLGLRRAAAALFADMPWGGARVAARTRQRMEALGWAWEELPVLWDLDRPEDLRRFEDLS